MGRLDQHPGYAGEGIEWVAAFDSVAGAEPEVKLYFYKRMA